MSKDANNSPSTSPTLAQRIQIGEFNDPPRPPKLPKGRVHDDNMSMIDWQAECKTTKDRFKTALFAEYDVTGNPMSDKAYNLAVDYANGAGLQEIVNYYEDLVQFVRAARTDNTNAFVQELNVWELSYDEDCGMRPILFLKTDDVDKAQKYGGMGGSSDRLALLTVEFNNRLYRLGDEIRTSYETPDEIRERAIRKLKVAGLTPEEITSLGVLP